MSSKPLLIQITFKTNVDQRKLFILREGCHMFQIGHCVFLQFVLNLHDQHNSPSFPFQVLKYPPHYLVPHL